METDVNKTIRKTKNRWEDDKRNDMKKLKIKNWTSCIQDRNNWKEEEKGGVGQGGREDEGGG